MQTLWNFRNNFWKNLQKIVRKIKINLEKKAEEIRKILEIFGALMKICQEALQSLIRHFWLWRDRRSICAKFFSEGS